MRCEKRMDISCGRRIGHKMVWHVASLAAFLLLVACLVPLVAISLYNHSYADDWHYGVWAHLALQESGSIVQAIIVALEQVPKAWNEWQGTYTAIFLMAIQPGVFGEQYYVVAAPCIMAALIAGSMYFWHVVLIDTLHTHTSLWMVTSCLSCVLQLELLPSPVEGIFWYNSAVYYTFFHALSLVFFAVLFRVACLRCTKRAIALSCILAVLVAGGNYITVLVTLELSAALLAVQFVRRAQGSVYMLPAFCLLCIGAMISMAAPGNGVRQVTQFPDAGLSVVNTIWQAIVQGLELLVSWTDGYVMLFVCALAPLVAYGMYANRDKRPHMRFPALVSLGSIALFCSSLTPTLFSMGTSGPGRVLNAYYYLYIVLVVINLLWWAGWLIDTFAVGGASCVDTASCSNSAPREDIIHLEPTVHPSRAAQLTSSISCTCIVLLAFCACITLANVDTTASESISSLSAARSLITGQAQRYDEQVWQRITTIEEALTSYVEVPFYTDVPRVLYMGDIRDNMDNYINYRLAQWYDKSAIIGVAPDS